MTEYDLLEFEDPMESVFYGDTFRTVEPETIIDQDRWHTYYSSVLQHKGTGEYWEAVWARGSTECQDCDPDLRLTKVEPYEVLVTKYRPVEA